MRHWIATALIVCTAGPAAAQQRLGVELRGGASIPAAELRDGLFPGGGLSPGPSFAVQVVIPRGARSALLVGFGQHRFRCSGDACDGAADAVATSWVLSARVGLLAREEAPWVRLGVLFDRSESDFPVDGARERQASALAVGGELGVGYTLRLSPRVALLPGARYTLVGTRFPGERRARMHYVVADLGVLLGF